MDLLEVIWSRDFVQDGYWVRGVDIKYPEFSETEANEFICMDLTDVDRSCVELFVMV